jgi:hypothetical protein
MICFLSFLKEKVLWGFFLLDVSKVSSSLGSRICFGQVVCVCDDEQDYSGKERKKRGHEKIFFLGRGGGDISFGKIKYKFYPSRSGGHWPILVKSPLTVSIHYPFCVCPR